MSLRFFTPIGGMSAPPPPTTLLFDDFTGSDGTNLTVHTPAPVDPGASWVKMPGETDDIVIESNEAAMIAGNDAGYMIDVGVTTGTAIMNVNIDTGDTQIGIGFNFGSFTDGWALYGQPLAGLAFFYEYGGGGQQGLVVNTFSSGPQEWKVVFDVSNAAFYIDGVLITSVATPNVRTPTNWGILMFKNAGLTPGTTIPDFKVTSP